jgi:effector-binding domain-containing protein
VSAPQAAPAILEVKVDDLAAQDYLGCRFESPLETVGLNVQKAMAGLYTHIQASGSAPSGPPFLIASQPSGGSMSIEVGAPCAPVPNPGYGQHRGQLEATAAVVALYRGPYEGIGPVYEEVFRWASTHGYGQAGAPREVYLNGPDEVTSSSEYLTQVVLPVRRM